MTSEPKSEQGEVIRKALDSFPSNSCCRGKDGKGRRTCGICGAVFFPSNRWQQSVIYDGAALLSNSNERGMTLQADLYQLQP